MWRRRARRVSASWAMKSSIPEMSLAMPLLLLRLRPPRPHHRAHPPRPLSHRHVLPHGSPAGARRMLAALRADGYTAVGSFDFGHWFERRITQFRHAAADAASLAVHEPESPDVSELLLDIGDDVRRARRRGRGRPRRVAAPVDSGTSRADITRPEPTTGHCLERPDRRPGSPASPKAQHRIPRAYRTRTRASS